ncbi:MAG: prephenate dehydratase, partial [Nitrospinaceae bacterium]|nr:prephenate dehydratase [Nitrospinaceae bacterium]
QGGRASFHEQAARKFFGSEPDLMECMSFQQVFDALADGEADMAVMAIENSVAGSILPNYSRLRDSGYRITGEVYIRIEMHLLALPGQALSDIREVHSHPIAILQSHAFFRDHPHLLAVESDDTAQSAREIAEGGIRGRGALASREAAALYGLEILREGVETNKRNFTRFLVIRPIDNPGPGEVS